MRKRLTTGDGDKTERSVDHSVQQLQHTALIAGGGGIAETGGAGSEGGASTGSGEASTCPDESAGTSTS
jgi:hypothetical protein